MRVEPSDRWVVETFAPSVERPADLLLAHGAESEAEALEDAHHVRRGVVEEVLRIVSEEGGKR